MARLLLAAAAAGGVLGEAAGAEGACAGGRCAAADEGVSLLAMTKARSASRSAGGKASSGEGARGQGGGGFLGQIREDWDNGRPVMTTAWGGLDGSLDQTLFSDVITWSSAQDYFFVKDVSAGCDPTDINKDALCSSIAYISMMRKDLFNTYFSNDGLYGHRGRPGIVLKPSYWNSADKTGERVNFKQGWFIDSWPDYRFVSDKTAAEIGPEDRFVGLNYRPSGYRTTISWAYTEKIEMITEEVAEQADKVDKPPYLVGETGTGADAYFSFEAPLADATEQAFVDYYGAQQNYKLGAFECFDKTGKKPKSGCNTGANVNFFQGFVDFNKAGLADGLERLATFRKAYFGKRLYKNSDNGPPFGNEVELDAYPWKEEPPRSERKDGDNFTSYMIPYPAVGAVTLMHGGPRWTLSTRPQPPHISVRPTEWGVDPEYYYLYKAHAVLFEGIKARLPPGVQPPEQWEVSNIWGTDFAGPELEEHIEAWRSSPEGVAASDVFNPWVDYYADEPGSQYEVSKFLLPPPTKGGRSYYRVTNVVKKLDARWLAVEAGFGVWASACSKAVGGVTIVASPGDDDLYGGSGDDRLVAQGATDRLTGGPGADTFVIEASSAGVIVTDLEVTDVLEIEGCGSASDVSVGTAYWPGVLPDLDTPISQFRGGDNYTVVGLPGRPALVQLWRVDPKGIDVEVVRHGAQRACLLTLTPMPPAPPGAPRDA